MKNAMQATAVLGGVLSGAPASAQEPPPRPRAEEPDSSFPLGNLPLPGTYFKIDDFVAATEGTVAERKRLAEELYKFVSEKGASNEKGDGIEMLFPLNLSNENVTIRVSIYTDRGIEMWVRVFRNDNTPIALIDRGITGTPTEHQLPVEEGGKQRPQGFAVSGEHPLANRIYLGLLRHIELIIKGGK